MTRVTKSINKDDVKKDKKIISYEIIHNFAKEYELFRTASENNHTCIGYLYGLCEYIINGPVCNVKIGNGLIKVNEGLVSQLAYLFYQNSVVFSNVIQTMINKHKKDIQKRLLNTIIDIDAFKQQILIAICEATIKNGLTDSQYNSFYYSFKHIANQFSSGIIYWPPLEVKNKFMTEWITDFLPRLNIIGHGKDISVHRNPLEVIWKLSLSDYRLIMYNKLEDSYGVNVENVYDGMDGFCCTRNRKIFEVVHSMSVLNYSPEEADKFVFVMGIGVCKETLEDIKRHFNGKYNESNFLSGVIHVDPLELNPTRYCVFTCSDSSFLDKISNADGATGKYFSNLHDCGELELRDLSLHCALSRDYGNFIVENEEECISTCTNQYVMCRMHYKLALNRNLINCYTQYIDDDGRIEHWEDHLQNCLNIHFEKETYKNGTSKITITTGDPCRTILANLSQLLRCSNNNEHQFINKQDELLFTELENDHLYLNSVLTLSMKEQINLDLFELMKWYVVCVLVPIITQ